MFAIKLKVTWRTIDEQGPKYDPHISEDILYFDEPIFKSEIMKAVARLYSGSIVDKVEIKLEESK